MDGAILVINAGSSSIKFSVYRGRDGALDAGACGQVEGIGTAPRLQVRGLPDDARVDVVLDPAQVRDHAGAIGVIHGWLTDHHAGEHDLVAIGHRVVHGGMEYDRPVRLDTTVLAALEALVPLAPLHQPHALAAIRAATAAAPAMPQYACFDTAFHRGQARLAQIFALPRALTDEGVRRYGFHGLSYEYIAASLPPELAGGRVVVAHLGNGASLCAMRAGRSVASTMGFTALDGLMMGTRAGALDPGVVLYLLEQRGMTAAQVTDLLYNRSGLLGVSGLSSDMRTLLASASPQAKEAVDLFAYRIARELGSLAAALGGLDGLVFTAGIGEHAPHVRAAVLHQAGWLGLTLDAAANETGGPRISAAGAGPSAWVIPTDENLMIARHVARLHAAAAG
ncbi:acetate/propionate family kinase [Limobrevibacterium gyesilva]